MHSPFAVERDDAHGRTYQYQRDFVRVSDNAADDKVTHHWTGTLLRHAELGEADEDPAYVSCGDGGACDECHNGPPCGGTIKPSTAADKHIVIHPDADMADELEISLAKYPQHQIAILDASQPVPAALDVWRKRRVCGSAVYHVYRIKSAPSRRWIEGKLIAIAVPPNPVPSTQHQPRLPEPVSIGPRDHE